MLRGFRDFITRGNVLDLAVAFVAGAAFTALVTSVTDSIINPAVGLVLGGGMEAGTFEVNGQVFDYGAVINAGILFLLTMVVLYFAFVAPMNAWRRHREQEQDEEVAGPSEAELLTEIRDLLRAQQQR